MQAVRPLIWVHERDAVLVVPGAAVRVVCAHAVQRGLAVARGSTSELEVIHDASAVPTSDPRDSIRAISGKVLYIETVALGRRGWLKVAVALGTVGKHIELGSGGLPYE